MQLIHPRIRRFSRSAIQVDTFSALCTLSSRLLDGKLCHGSLVRLFSKANGGRRLGYLPCMETQQICDAVSDYLQWQGYWFGQVLTGNDRSILFAGPRVTAAIELGLGSKLDANRALRLVAKVARAQKRKPNHDAIVVLPSVSRPNISALAVLEQAGVRVLTVGADGEVTPLQGPTSAQMA
jgi:hypothetical protein